MVSGTSVWPRWYPGLELGAEHLLGLEDYLLERNRIVDGGFGVAEFDCASALRLETSAEGWTLTLLRVSGVTPAGQPVRVVSEQPLLAELPPSFENQSLDLWVEVNPEEGDDKLKLQPTPVSDTFFPDGEWSDERLHLGRYTISDEGMELLERPLLLWLAALAPHDEAWKAWTQPLAGALQGRLNAAASASGAIAQAAHHELARLSVDWPITSLPTLVWRLERAQRLLAWAVAPRDADVQPPMLDQPGAWLTNRSGESLPVELAGLLDAASQPESMPVSEGLTEALLAELLQPVRLRVPLTEFRMWQEALGSGLLEQDQRILLSALRSRVTRGRLDPWSRVVGLVSLLALRLAAARVPNDLLKAYVGRWGELPREVESCLERLMGKEAAREPAGPLGFLQIALAAIRLPTEISARSGVLQAYLKALESGVPAGLSHGGDRVQSFLAVRWLATAPAKISFAAGPNETIQALSAAPQGMLRIAVVGPRGSGRSAIIRSWQSGMAAEFPGWSLHLDTEAKEWHGIQVANGFLASPGNDWDVEVLECDPSYPEVVRDERLAACDLVLLVLDPATLDSQSPPEQLLAQMVRLAGRPDIQGVNGRLCIRLCFSKADAYGTFEPRSLRLFEAESAISGDMARRTDWLDEARRQGTDGNIADPHWAETRTIVLEQTKLLWRGLQKRPSEVSLNAYFVAADPVDPYLEAASARGTLQLLWDFINAI